MGLAEWFDAAILVWLIGTWFWEGHHKRCAVDVSCPACGADSTVTCKADRRSGEVTK